MNYASALSLHSWLALGLTATLALGAAAANAAPAPITVFVARQIVKMDAVRPTATSVAVRDGKIIGVGSLADLAPWLKSGPYTIDESFKDKVLLPGLIDPHLHPLLGALQFGTVWITPETW